MSDLKTHSAKFMLTHYISPITEFSFDSAILTHGLVELSFCPARDFNEDILACCELGSAKAPVVSISRRILTYAFSMSRHRELDILRINLCGKTLENVRFY